MSHSDELRILAEMQTFTQRDFASAIECTPQWASQVFEQLVRERVIERVRVGHSWLYALTARGKARVAKMPVIDTEERCLLLDVVPQSELLCPDCAGAVTVTRDNGQFRFAKCDYCFALWYSSKYPDGWSEWRIDDIPF